MTVAQPKKNTTQLQRDGWSNNNVLIKILLNSHHSQQHSHLHPHLIIGIH